MKEEKIILISGALDIETEYYIQSLENKITTTIAGYEFSIGTIGHLKVIVSKTLVGVINATMATTLGILHFHPNIVINQGIAGAHTSDLHVGDVIIGETCYNINAYKMPFKQKGQGSNPFEWEPNKRAKVIKSADANLVNIFKDLDHNASIGTLGSGDVFNQEYDRIIWTNQVFHSLCEDMESIGVYSVCNQLEIPCIGIRIISNNELLQEKLDKSQAIELQKRIIDVLKKNF